MDLNNIPHLTLCSGMTRSASRWSYQTCQELEKTRTPPEKFSKGYLGEKEDVIDSNMARILGTKDGGAVFASHAFSKRALQLIEHGIAKNVYTYRDPRDSIASSMRMDGKGYEFAFTKIHFSLSLFDQFCDDGHSLIIAYSNILSNPIGVTASIAAYLEIKLNEDGINKVHQETERLAIERRNEQRRQTAFTASDIAAIDGGLEVLHGDVASSPNIDNPWRYGELTEDQYADATHRLQPWLSKMNFSSSPIPPWKQD
jgi:hypothetical protein